MLTIKNLCVSVEDKAILKGINLDVKPGEVHAIMGPNGSGKSTLGNIIAGRDGYTVTDGSVEYLGENILELSPEERAHKGIFLAFQYPVEIPGIANINFLKSALNTVRKSSGLEPLDAMDFYEYVKEKLALVKMQEDFLYRSLNTGFSGGEKKRNEILQMAVLQPKLAVLDETDSGLDIDALKIVADGVNTLRGGDRAIIVVTHYQRLLDHIVPDHVHVLADGQIIRSGDKSLALELESKGYSWIDQAEAV
jgi:Fe-S cluster assembly ATP-binding protein